LTSTKSSGGSGGGKAHSTPKASLPRHRAHLVSGDSASYAYCSFNFKYIFYLKLFIFIFIYKLLINGLGHRSTQWLRRQLSDPYVRYAYCRRWASLCAAKAFSALS
jgi:hypothetical protein